MSTRKTTGLMAILAVSALGLAACSGGSGGDATDAPATGDTTSAASDGGDSGFSSDFDPGDRITMIVPMGPGGGSDLSGRSIAAGLEGITGKTISVENQEGGGGAVGYSAFLSNEGDPTYLLATETALVNLALTQDVPFSWESFTPIMKVGQDTTMMVVPTASEYNTCMDVVTAAQESDVKVAVSGGVTGNDAIQFGLIEQDQGVTFQRVPYESGGEALAAALGGHVDVALANPGEVLGQLEAGELKALCVIAPERFDYPELADIETTVEQGIDVTFAQFRGIIAPGGLDDEAVEYWVEASRAYVESDAYEEYMSSNYMLKDPLFGDDFAAYLEEYTAELEAGLGTE